MWETLWISSGSSRWKSPIICIFWLRWNPRGKPPLNSGSTPWKMAEQSFSSYLVTCPEASPGSYTGISFIPFTSGSSEGCSKVSPRQWENPLYKDLTVLCPDATTSAILIPGCYKISPTRCRPWEREFLLFRCLPYAIFLRKKQQPHAGTLRVRKSSFGVQLGIYHKFYGCYLKGRLLGWWYNPGVGITAIVRRLPSNAKILHISNWSVYALYCIYSQSIHTIEEKCLYLDMKCWSQQC